MCQPAAPAGHLVRRIDARPGTRVPARWIPCTGSQHRCLAVKSRGAMLAGRGGASSSHQAPAQVTACLLQALPTHPAGPGPRGCPRWAPPAWPTSTEQSRRRRACARPPPRAPPRGCPPAGQAGRQAAQHTMTPAQTQALASGCELMARKELIRQLARANGTSRKRPPAPAQMTCATMPSPHHPRSPRPRLPTLWISTKPTRTVKPTPRDSAATRAKMASMTAGITPRDSPPGVKADPMVYVLPLPV